MDTWNLERRSLMAGFLNEFPLPPPLVEPIPTEIFKGPDGNLWFEDAGAKQIGRITPEGTVAEFRLPPGSPTIFTGGFTTGPDGNLWFPLADAKITPRGKFTLYETVNGAIARITPEGVITEFPLPTTLGVAPSRMVVAPDGNLWFTEDTFPTYQQHTRAIGRITTAGVITDFPLTGQDLTILQGIEVGADGNLWFGSFHNIGRITTAGVVTTFDGGFNNRVELLAPDGKIWFTTSPLSGDVGRISLSGEVGLIKRPDGLLNGHDLVIGSDNNVWFLTGLVARATPDGTLTEFSLPSPDYPLSNLTQGSDGNLWFVAGSSGHISAARVTPAGVITEFPISPDSSETNFTITAGPDGDLWIAEGAGSKVARVTTAGAITEFPLPRVVAPAVPSKPLAITSGPDGALWFTEIHGQVDRISTAGVVTQYALPLPTEVPGGIATGADGNLWFTEKSNKIGRITPSGVITEFPLPMTDATPQAIVAGPDGNLWFTEEPNQVLATQHRIGRITPAGVITEFPVAPYYSMAIGAGPDGNLWFAEDFKIGRITPSGTVAEFALPVGSTHPVSFTAGPDGNLWFTEAIGKVSRITPTGTVTEFATPYPDSQLGAITAGADGNLWFLYENQPKIGRITTTGTITEFVTPSTPTQRPGGIVTGPDGNLWFTESDKIGQVVPAELRVPLPLSITLDPASDGGASPSDGITNVNRPTFVGVTAPGATVQVFAQGPGQSAPAALGQVTADTSGRWTFTSGVLADGAYVFTATASDALGRTSTASLSSPSTLIIVREGPKVAGVRQTSKGRTLAITFLGGLVGLDPGSLINRANYTLTHRIGRRVAKLAVTGITVAAPSGTNGAVTVSLKIGGGHRLRPGTYTLTIASGGVADRAGNPLDGRFTGKFPSGGPQPGVAFVARLIVAGHHPLRALSAASLVVRRGC